MSCFLNFDKCINAVEKKCQCVHASVIEKSHKQKIGIDFKILLFAAYMGRTSSEK